MAESKIGTVLTPEERAHPLWMKLKAHMEGRIALLRKRNDRPIDDRKTNLLRGGIGELTYMVSLGEEKPIEPPENALFKD